MYKFSSDHSAYHNFDRMYDRTKSNNSKIDAIFNNYYADLLSGKKKADAEEARELARLLRI